MSFFLQSFPTREIRYDEETFQVTPLYRKNPSNEVEFVYRVIDEQNKETFFPWDTTKEVVKLYYRS